MQAMLQVNRDIMAYKDTLICIQMYINNVCIQYTVQPTCIIKLVILNRLFIPINFLTDIQRHVMLKFGYNDISSCPFK